MALTVDVTPPKKLKNSDFGEEIVISGIAGLYPSANHVKDLSDILYNKVNPISNKNSRWQYNHPEVAQYSGKVPGLRLFDAQFFKVHNLMANNTDPMSRKIMEQSYQAIYDAGMSLEELNGKRVGVYIGCSFSETEKICLYVSNSKTGFGIAGCNKAMHANRISYWLNSKGPSLTIDQGGCSSSVALEQAYQAIYRGECESAIVAGGSLCLHPHSSVHYGRIMKMSMNGETKSFDKNASGFTKSEAVNVLFLQKAKNARRIYAEVVYVKSEFTTILEGASGPKYGFYRDPLSMVKFMEQFYKEAKVSPQEVEYVEAFGSAIPEADEAELEAIDQVFCKSRQNPLLVGSILSNIGYCEAASGISSITKVLLGYYNRKLAGNLNCDSPRQDIAGLLDGRMQIVTDHQNFEGSYTAVNGLSVTGVNSHVLLKGHYKPKDLSRYKSNIPYLVTVSARQETSIQTILNDLKSRPVDPEELALLHNIHKSRILGYLGRGFTILGTDENNKTVCISEKANHYDDATRPLWFVYSGMGSQWAGMGAQLMKIPIFADAIERCRQVLEPKGVDIVHIITSPDKKIFDNILHSFVGIAAIQIGLTDILTALEIFPDKIIGHSVGEMGCAYADGCFTAEEMILAAYSRGLVSVQTPFIRGSMAAVGVGYEQISKMCPPKIEVACHNGPDSSTISGPTEIVEEFIVQLTKKDIYVKEVPCSNIAYHSSYIAEAGPGLLKYLEEVIPSPKLRSERWVSTSVPEDKWDEPMARYSSAEYHTNNLLNPVLFEETLQLIPSNAVLVEIAPHGLLQSILKGSLPESCKNIPLTRRGHPDNAIFLLEAIGKLYLEGYNPKTQALYPKIEFPVSTETPMLSHLVEWAHHERWIVPLYIASHKKKIAASRKHILSIHDDEHSYLKGNVIRGNNFYPFSGVLVAVWDTLAMILNVEKKQLSVQFQDVHIHSHEIISETKQLKLHISIQRGTGRFEVLNYDILIVSGYISNDIIDVNILNEESIEDLLHSDDIYQLLNARGYNYTKDFRTIYNVNQSLTKGQIAWSDNWITFIDGLIQMNLLRKSGDSTTYPNYVKRITIDINQHSRSKTVEVDGFFAKDAEISELYNWSRAGGVLIEHMQFKDLPNGQANEIALKTLTFIPHFTTDTIDEDAALYAFLQIVADNLNKEEISIIAISDHTDGTPDIENIENIAKTIPGLEVKISYIHHDNIREQSNKFKTVDSLFINNLSIDDNMCQILHQALNCDTFIINKKINIDERLNKLPSALYRGISKHIIGNECFELSSWRPSEIASSTSAFSVVSTLDLASLVSSIPTLPSKERIIILSSYPPVPGLKNLIKEWKSKDNRKINLVMINQEIAEEQALDQMPFSNLSVNILNHGVWGGECFLPMQNDTVESGEKALEIKQLGNVDTLQWVKAPEPNNRGMTVTINYAGINDVDVKTKLNGLSHHSIDSKMLIEFDFSGNTESGIPVMGIVQEESIRTKVKARPELLWPVPKHWSLEDAATVPLAYVMAFYCLCIKARLYSGITILVHGGAGALGQAIISIALAHGCEIFTTVSDTKKKHFLCKVFPQLKEDHILNSRNFSFSDTIFYKTKGLGCNIVISCVQGTLKDASLKCCAPRGTFIDTSVILNHEDYQLGMLKLSDCISYVILKFSTIFEPRNINELKQIQYMMSEGIARGYVRPLTRVTYAPSGVTRAYRLFASSSHRGRVLLNLQKEITCVQTKIHCQSDLYHLLVSENEILGIQLAERLITRGARKLVLHFTKQSNCLLLKLRLWKKQGIEVKVSDGNDIANITENNNFPQSVEGICYIDVSESVAEKINNALESINLFQLQLSSQLKYFAIISTDNEYAIVPLPEAKLLTTRVILTMFKTNENSENHSITPRDATDAIEKAVCSNQRVILGYLSRKPNQSSLIKDIARVADIEISNDISGKFTLRELGMSPFRTEAVMRLLHNNNSNVTFNEANILSLTVDSIRELELNNKKYEEKSIKGLKNFYSYVDHDELLATSEIILLPSLANSSLVKDCEFDGSQRYLCLVPGVEGHHSRFSTLCESLKVPVMVLQPPFHQPKITIREMAERFAKILMQTLKEDFFLLGYERGVLVALEMASILESYGFTGTVFCIGGTPEEIKEKFEQELSYLDTEEALQEEVLRHMLTLISNKNPDNVETVLQKNIIFEEKISNCIQMMGDSISNSTQYSKEIILAAYTSILEIRRYVSDPKPLCSLIVYMRPDDIAPIANDKQYSKHPEVVYELQSSLPHAAHDLSCPAIVNRHLGQDVQSTFEKQNLLDTYLINNQSFESPTDDSNLV